jgi:hypothetical protein
MLHRQLLHQRLERTVSVGSRYSTLVAIGVCGENIATHTAKHT